MGNADVTAVYAAQDGQATVYAGGLVLEGATADASETTLGLVDPTADRTINLPNQSGTLPVLAAASATAITSTPEELNILDGGTSATTTTVADADRLVMNDNSTMVQVAVTDLKTYIHSNTSLNDLSDVQLINTNADESNAKSMYIGNAPSASAGDAVANIGVGVNVLNNVTEGDYNVGIGWRALKHTTTGGKNIAIGAMALRDNVSHYGNVAIGYQSMQDANGAELNTAVGINAMRGTIDTDITGDYNVAVGTGSLKEIRSGDKNTAIGAYALLDLTTGNSNNVMGYEAAQNITNGNYNVAIGNHTLNANNSGDDNVAIGNSALYSNTSSDNTAVGFNALYNTNSSNNVGIGWKAGNEISSGTDNVVIGYNASVGTATANNQIVIGSGATGLGVNTAVIGPAATTTIYASEDAGAYIYGAGMKVADGSDLTIGNENLDAYLKVAASATAGNEDVRIVNTNGTDEAAIAVTSTAGGVDVDAAAAKDINVAGGQVALVSKDDAASAISLTANIGSSETIVVTNTQGTTDGIDDAGAIELSAAAGGIGLAWSDSKDLWAEGGRAVITANEDAADAIKLHADAGSSQTINLVNDAGTNAAAIALTSTAGGVTISTASSSATSVNGNLTGTSTNTSANTGAISGFDASLNAATLSSNSYTLVASDNGKVVTIDNNTTAATVVIPTGLGDGFNCLIVQKGNHQTTISPVSGSVTIANRSSETKTAAQYAVISIINIGSETYIVSGDTGS